MKISGILSTLLPHTIANAQIVNRQDLSVVSAP